VPARLCKEIQMSKGNKEAKKPKRVMPVATTPVPASATPVPGGVVKPKPGKR
jgi:hypothetical protein